MNYFYSSLSFAANYFRYGFFSSLLQYFWSLFDPSKVMQGRYLIFKISYRSLHFCLSNEKATHFLCNPWISSRGLSINKETMLNMPAISPPSFFNSFSDAARGPIDLLSFKTNYNMSFIISFGTLSKCPERKLKKSVTREELNRILFSASGILTFNYFSQFYKKSSPFLTLD